MVICVPLCGIRHWLTWTNGCWFTTQAEQGCNATLVAIAELCESAAPINALVSQELMTDHHASGVDLNY
jgi:hypothetical protein